MTPDDDPEDAFLERRVGARIVLGPGPGRDILRAIRAAPDGLTRAEIARRFPAPASRQSWLRTLARAGLVLACYRHHARPDVPTELVYHAMKPTRRLHD